MMLANPRIKRGLLVMISFLCLLGGVGWPTYHWMKQEITHERIQHRSQLYPLIFVPGSSATVNRFDGLFNKLTQATHQRHSVLKLTVLKTGQLQLSGKISSHDRQPFIVIGFQDNLDGTGPIRQQAKWFATAMTYLTHHYHFNRFSAIGHSNGGLILTLYLENSLNQNRLSIKRLLTIGTPYNLEISTNEQTDLLKQLIARRKHLPRNLQVESIMGTVTYVNDGIVPEASVLAGKYIFQNEVSSYTVLNLTGKESQHSALPENRHLVNLIVHRFLQLPHARRSQSQFQNSR